MATTNRKAEADRTLAPTYTSNVMMPSSHIPGRDSVRQPDETTGKSSLSTVTLGVAEKSEVATPNYGKRLSDTPSPQISFV